MASSLPLPMTCMRFVCLDATPHSLPVSGIKTVTFLWALWIVRGTKGLHFFYVLLEHQATVTSRDYRKTFLGKIKQPNNQKPFNWKRYFLGNFFIFWKKKKKKLYLEIETLFIRDSGWRNLFVKGRFYWQKKKKSPKFSMIAFLIIYSSINSLWWLWQHFGVSGQGLLASLLWLWTQCSLLLSKVRSACSE